MSQSGFDRFRVPHGFPASTDLLHRRYQASPVQPRVEARLLRHIVTGKSLSRSDRSPRSTRRAFTLKFFRTVRPRLGSRHLKLLRLAFTAGEVGYGDPDHGLFGAIPSDTASKISSTGSDGDDPRNLGAWDEIQIVHPSAGASGNSRIQRRRRGSRSSQPEATRTPPATNPHHPADRSQTQRSRKLLQVLSGEKFSDFPRK